MEDKPATIVEQSVTDDDVDVNLFVRVVQLFHEGVSNRPKIEALFGRALHLSAHDSQPADRSVLRRFRDGPARNELVEVSSEQERPNTKPPGMKPR